MNIEQEEKKEKKEGIFFAIVSVATLAAAIIGATFAWFSATASSDEIMQVVKTGILSIDYTDGSSIFATNLKPATLAQVLESQATCQLAADVSTTETVCSRYRFSVTNNGTLNAIMNANVALSVKDKEGNDATFTANALKYIIVEGDTVGANPTVNSYSGTFNGTPTNVTINTGETKTYTILFYLDGTIATNADQAKILTGSIIANATQVNAPNN